LNKILYMHYIEPSDRNQIIFMNKLDDFVSSDNSVRLLDYMIDSIIKEQPLSFIDKGQFSIGRRAYAPGLFIKLYIYGYFNGINSSRKLEREAQRNLEVIWLLGALRPDFKTIADYRKDNGDKIERVLQQFISFLRTEGYIEGHTVSLDGTKVRAYAGQAIKMEGLEGKLQNLKSQLKDYFDELDHNDQEDDFKNSGEKEELLNRIKELEDKIQFLESGKDFLVDNKLKQYSPTDPQARMMKGRQGKHFSYNVQATVDEKNKMIITTEVRQEENDKNLLEPAVERLQESGVNPAILLGDTGFHKTDAIQNVEAKNIACFIPINENQSTLKDKENGITFTYKPEEDQYICYQGNPLKSTHITKIDNRRKTIMTAYEAEDCSGCVLKVVCCKEKNKRIKWRHQDQQWRDDYEARMKTAIAKMLIEKRKQLSEHPFGTIKYWMGVMPLKTRGKRKVQTEINLYHIAYNFKRLINILNINQLMHQFRMYNWATT
jgi:transposase